MCLNMLSEKSIIEIGKDFDNRIVLKYLKKIFKFFWGQLRMK